MSTRTIEMALATPGLDAQGRPTRIPLRARPRPTPKFDEDFGAEHMLVNIGPQHPATHGVLRLVRRARGRDGQARAFRTSATSTPASRSWASTGTTTRSSRSPTAPTTSSPMANNVGLALAAEKLMGIEITERCRVLRVIACEMSRIISHLVWLGTTGIDLGAFTPFLWSFQERGADLQPAGVVDRRAAHDQPDAGRRHDGRHARRLGGGAARVRRDLPQDADRSGHDVHPERDLDRADPGRRRAHGRARRSTTRSRARCSGRAASTTTCGRTARTSATRPTTSTCRSASTATSTTATGSGWRRCGSRSGSWSRRSTGWPGSRARRSTSTTRA